MPSFGKLVFHNEDFLDAKNYILCQVSADAKIRDPALGNLQRALDWPFDLV